MCSIISERYGLKYDNSPRFRWPLLVRRSRWQRDLRDAFELGLDAGARGLVAPSEPRPRARHLHSV